MKEKFISYLNDNYYRIRIIRENPKFKYDERIHCSLKEAVEIRNKILKENYIELYKTKKNEKLLLFSKKRTKTQIKKNLIFKPQKVDKYIYTQSNGKYRVVIKKGSKTSTSYNYYSISGINSLKRAKEIRNKKLAELTLNKGKIKNDGITFYEFTNYWYKNYCEKELSPTTLTGIKTFMNNYILPSFASKKLSKITTKDLQMFFSDLKLRRKIRPNSNGEYELLSTNTTSGVYRLIRNVLNKAVYWDYLECNPINKVKGIAIKSKEKLIYSKEELTEIIKLLEDEDLFAQTVFTVLICSGIRRSELFGLYPENIDFDNSSIFIRRNAIWD
ncbi:MAG: hypothetical protein PHN72_05225 [Bacilli bacterium]|nr:hypothetical protein [Bacilli bacterium]